MMSSQARQPLIQSRVITVSACAVLLSLVSAGCPGDQGATSADCASAIRGDGTVYVEAGFTKHLAVASGQAERADCHDVGRDAPGIVFPGEPNAVNVVAFEDHDASQVLGVREGKKIRVFVAEGVAAEPVMNELEGDGDE
jgi:hypothetical protein